MNPWEVSNVSEFLKYCCPECEFSDGNLENFQKHALDSHEQSKSLFGQQKLELKLGKEGPKLVQKSLQFKCSLCDFKCSDLCQLAEHHNLNHKNGQKWAILTQENSFKCGQCEFESEKKFKVGRHFIEEHLDPLCDNYEVCQYCMEVFPDFNLLKVRT